MTIFIDSDYRCHTENDGTMRPVDTTFFDGKCKTYIEGYRYVPDGSTWVNPDGIEFPGVMIAPFVDYSRLQVAQEQYELDQDQMQDMQSALEILGVNP